MEEAHTHWLFYFLVPILISYNLVEFIYGFRHMLSIEK